MKKLQIKIRSLEKLIFQIYIRATLNDRVYKNLSPFYHQSNYFDILVEKLAFLLIFSN